MARSVYFDPFGARVEGFHAGMQDEMALQDNIRNARAKDWDYNNMAPIRLQEARRVADYNQYADPYMRRQLGLNERTANANLFNNEFNAYGLAGDVTGNYGPTVNLSQRYLGVPQTNPTDLQQQGAMERINREWLLRLADFRNAQQNTLFNQERQLAQDDWTRRTFGAITPSDVFRAQAFGQYGRYGAPAYNPNDFGMPSDPTQIPGTTQAQAAPYVVPGLNIPGYAPNSTNTYGLAVPGIGAPMQEPTGVPYPSNWQPAFGPNAINMYPTYQDGTPIPYGTPEYEQYMQQFSQPPQEQPEGEPVADAQGRPTDVSRFV